MVVAFRVRVLRHRPALLESLHHPLHSRRINVEISGYFAIGKFKCIALINHAPLQILIVRLRRIRHCAVYSHANCPQIELIAFRLRSARCKDHCISIYEPVNLIVVKCWLIVSKFTIHCIVYSKIVFLSSYKFTLIVYIVATYKLHVYPIVYRNCCYKLQVYTILFIVIWCTDQSVSYHTLHDFVVCVLVVQPQTFLAVHS